jgi:hypothetical protein
MDSVTSLTFEMHLVFDSGDVLNIAVPILFGGKVPLVVVPDIIKAGVDLAFKPIVATEESSTSNTQEIVKDEYWPDVVSLGSSKTPEAKKPKNIHDKLLDLHRNNYFKHNN